MVVGAHGGGEGGEDPAAGGAEGVADGDGAAAGVDDVGVGEAAGEPGVDADEGLDGEGFVELDDADVGPGDAGAVEGLLGGLDGGVAEVLGVEGVGAAPGDAGEGVVADPVGGGGGAEEDGGGAVAEGEALPAVMVPSGRNDGFSPARVSGVVSGRMPSSRVRSVPSTGTTRSSWNPDSQAVWARWWERAAKASWRSRETWWSSWSCSLASPRETVHSAGMRGLTSRQPRVVETSSVLAAG